MSTEKMLKDPNQTVLDAFSGFTPAQMHQIIYTPFSSDCPVKLSEAVDDSVLNLSPVFNISYSLLQKIASTNGLKLTAKGNLPLKIVKAIYSEGHLPDEMIERGIINLRLEEDWEILRTLHIILKMSGVLRKTQNKLYVTKKGNKFLETGCKSSFFYFLLETYTMKYNWGYNDAYDIENIGQIGFLYLLYLINLSGNSFHKRTDYINLYFEAFPVFAQTHKAGAISAIDYPKNALIVRFFERFAYWFGLIDYSDKDNSLTRNNEVEICKTPLLTALIKLNS